MMYSDSELENDENKDKNEDEMSAWDTAMSNMSRLSKSYDSESKCSDKSILICNAMPGLLERDNYSTQ